MLCWGRLPKGRERLRLGVAVNTLPIHHPVQLAEQAAMLDLLSQGRMDFAAGGVIHTAAPMNALARITSQRTRSWLEGLEIIRRAWSEDRSSFHGKFFQIPEVVVNPKPVQSPLPPFYMATSSSTAWKSSAVGHQSVAADPHPNTRASDRIRDAYWNGLKNTGHDHATRELGLLVPMHLAPTTAEAKARAEAGIMSYFKTIADMRSGLYRLADSTRR